MLVETHGYLDFMSWLRMYGEHTSAIGTISFAGAASGGIVENNQLPEIDDATGSDSLSIFIAVQRYSRIYNTRLKVWVDKVMQSSG